MMLKTRILLPTSRYYMIGFIRRLTLSQWIILAMIAGVLFGWQFPEAARQVGIVSDMFIRLIKCIIVPLLFGTLVIGIAGHTDDMKAVGRLALKSIVYFEVITTLALLIGLAAVNLVQPGAGIQMATTAGRSSELTGTKLELRTVLEHLAPQSLADAAAR